MKRKRERGRESDEDKGRIKFVTQRIRGRTERFEKKSNHCSKKKCLKIIYYYVMQYQKSF